MTPKPRLSMVELWRSQDPREWDYCESELYDAYVQPANRMIERELEKPGLRERIARMDAAQFYAFLRDEYFLWKFTSGPERTGNLKWLARHVSDGTMDRLERARRNLVNRGDFSKDASILMLMGRHGGVHGLAVAGASGLLALVYPEEYGTVDVKVTEALQQVGLPPGDADQPESHRHRGRGHHDRDHAGEGARTQPHVRRQQMDAEVGRQGALGRREETVNALGARRLACVGQLRRVEKAPLDRAADTMHCALADLAGLTARLKLGGDLLEKLRPQPMIDRSRDRGRRHLQRHASVPRRIKPSRAARLARRHR
jgi:hypothetical protein